MIPVNLIPWTQLTRAGVPQFLVARRPLLVEGKAYPVGDTVPPRLFSSRVRLRQMYEQRRIVPAVAPKRSVRAVNEARGVSPVQSSRELIAAVDTFAELPDLLDLPGIDIAEVDDSVPVVSRPNSQFGRRRQGQGQAQRKR